MKRRGAAGEWTSGSLGRKTDATADSDRFSKLESGGSAGLTNRMSRQRAQPAAIRTSKPTTVSDIERWKQIRSDGMHPLNRQELERLLEKVAADGPQRLTPDERAFLDRMAG